MLKLAKMIIVIVFKDYFEKYNLLEGDKLMKYICDICDWIYDENVGDPDNGVAPGTKWADLPDDFVCPLCNVGKDKFSEVK